VGYTAALSSTAPATRDGRRAAGQSRERFRCANNECALTHTPAQEHAPAFVPTGRVTLLGLAPPMYCRSSASRSSADSSASASATAAGVVATAMVGF
jgi:hypothetical protein